MIIMNDNTLGYIQNRPILLYSDQSFLLSENTLSHSQRSKKQSGSIHFLRLLEGIPPEELHLLRETSTQDSKTIVDVVRGR